MHRLARAVTLLAVSAAFAAALPTVAVPAAAVPAAAVPAALVAEVRCEPVETAPDEGHLHLLGDATPPVGYRSTPPASGWHYRQRDRVRLGVAPASEPLSEPEHVSVLAVGGVVISHRDLPAADLEALEALVSDLEPRPVALTSYAALEPGQVALSAWRRIQRCDGADLGAVEAFVDAYAAAEPDFAMTGGGIHDHDDTPQAVGGSGEPGVGTRGSWPPWTLGAIGIALLAGFAAAARRALRASPAPGADGASQATGTSPPTPSPGSAGQRGAVGGMIGSARYAPRRPTTGHPDRAGSPGIDQP